MSADGMTCPCGGEAERVKSINVNGTVRVFDRCKICGANVRGAGKWVSHAVAGPLDKIPTVATPVVPPRPKQPTLWGEEDAET